MATEPFNVFSRRVDVGGVISILRKFAGQLDVSGPDDDWRNLNAWTRKRLFRKRSRLLVVHDPEYYDGPGWPAQVLGMHNYVARFPESPRKQYVLRLVASFRFALAFPESDFDIRGRDERVGWIHAICRHLDGVIFTPSQLLDANGRVLISCDGRSDSSAVLPVIPAADAESAPVVSDVIDEPEQEPEPPLPIRVAKRALVLVAVANRGFVEHQRTQIERPDEIRIAMLQWANAVGIEDEIEPDEWKVLQRPVGSLDVRATINAVWRFEGLAVLLWAMERYQLPAYDQLATPDDLFQATSHFDAPAAKEIIEAARLRSCDQLKAYQTHALMVHWRLRNYRLHPCPMDFVAFSKDCWFGKFDLSPFSILENDVAIGGLPIRKANRQIVQACNSSAMERHQAINWLFGYDKIYSQVDTST
jgi:hypothetical protein